MDRQATLTFARFDAAELRLCRYLNRSSRSAPVRKAFALVSWLGNGWLWYAVLLALPLRFGTAGLLTALHLALTGGLCLAVYKLIKTRTLRERPYITHSAIDCATAPLDRYSFPSGHTLHAVCFTIMLASYYPSSASAFVVLTTLIALSRVVLGLHYPTDVAAGALLGASLGLGSLLAAQYVG